MQRIVCAANRNEVTGDVIIGIRHWDHFMHEQYKHLDCHCVCGKFEQGFIDNQGNFLSRTEAWKIAEAASQIIKRVGGDDANGGRLYSENLY